MRNYFMITSALALLLSPAQVFASSGALRYGSACQESYESNWLPTITGAGTSCSNFRSQMAAISGSTQRFNYNLQGNGPRILEEGWDSNSLIEDVDIAFITTHTGSWTEYGADFAGWKRPPLVGGNPNYYGSCEAGDQSCGVSHRMKLGNELTGLSILAVAGCTTLSPTAAAADEPDPLLPSQIRHYGSFEDIWPRWSAAFLGGLRMTTGTWDVLWISSNNTVGNKFGSYLRSGNTIAEAWRKALLETDANNDPAIMATGTSDTNCSSRLYNMKISNFDVGNTNARIRDAQVKNFCWHRWW
jgi:hypothetical protein